MNGERIATLTEEEGEGDEHQDTNLLTRGTLRYNANGTLIIPIVQRYIPPSDTITPEELFPQKRVATKQFPRFTHMVENDTILIYTDGGTCTRDKQVNAAAGWGFVFREPEPDMPYIGFYYARLENRGPTGEQHPQTKDRAALRAVIAAIRFRVWYADGSTQLVIVTSSQYVTRGITEWVQFWGRFHLIGSVDTLIEDQDLWEELLRLIIGHREQGMEICFWSVPQAWNDSAETLAHEGAHEPQVERHQTPFAMLV